MGQAIPNPDLREERSDNLEVGYTQLMGLRTVVEVAPAQSTGAAGLKSGGQSSKQAAQAAMAMTARVLRRVLPLLTGLIPSPTSRNVIRQRPRTTEPGSPSSVTPARAAAFLRSCLRSAGAHFRTDLRSCSLSAYVLQIRGVDHVET